MQVMSNGRAVEVGGKNVYVIFDTGTTGLTVTRDLYESVQRDYQGAPLRPATLGHLVCVCALACVASIHMCVHVCVYVCACVPMPARERERS